MHLKVLIFSVHKYPLSKLDAYGHINIAKVI